jgi:hypothetical protein
LLDQIKKLPNLVALGVFAEGLEHEQAWTIRMGEGLMAALSALVNKSERYDEGYEITERDCSIGRLQKL